MGNYGELASRASMRGYWKLENVNDSSGNGRTMTNAGEVTFSAGKFKNCGVFTDSASSMLYRDGNILSALQVTNLTIVIWFKLASTTDMTNRIVTDVCTLTTGGPTGSRITIAVVVSSGIMTVRAVNTRVTTNSDVSFNINADTNWHSIVVTKAGTTLDLFLDGNNVGSSTGAGGETTITRSHNFYIGNSGSGGVPFVGNIDEVMVEERVWSASEIRRYYSQATGRSRPMIV